QTKPSVGGGSSCWAISFCKVIEQPRIKNAVRIAMFVAHRRTDVKAGERLVGCESPQLTKKCAVKGAGLQRVQLPPGNWFVPPGSNRSGSGGNEAVGAFGVEGHVVTRRAYRP